MLWYNSKEQNALIYFKEVSPPLPHGKQIFLIPSNSSGTVWGSSVPCDLTSLMDLSCFFSLFSSSLVRMKW